MFYITDKQTDEIISFIPKNVIREARHIQDLSNFSEILEIEAVADGKFSEYLGERNRIVYQTEDGEFRELRIENAYQYHDEFDVPTVEIEAVGSYADLITAKHIPKGVTEAWTATQHANAAVSGTEWRINTIASTNIRTLRHESPTNPFAYLTRIANEFELELKFSITIEGNRIVDRYIDLVEKIGDSRGKRVVFGKDLQGVEREEQDGNIVTALFGYGPEDPDGNQISVFVEDLDALNRWGRNGSHIVDYHDVMSENTEMTEEEVRRYTRTELNKRINASVFYTIRFANLEEVPGLEHEATRLGDTIFIKDEAFSPPLYLEARVFRVETNPINPREKKVEIGDFTVFTKEQVNSIWEQLQQEIRSKIGMSDLIEATYTRKEIDDKDNSVRTDAATDASNKANNAENNAKEHADSVAEQAEENANNYTDGIKQQIDAELLEKTDYEYVDGKLTLKADSETVQAINNTVEGLEQTTSNLLQSVADNADALSEHGGRITTVEADLDEVEGQLSVALTDLSTLDGTVSQQGTQISANSAAISLKADKTELDTLNGNISDISGQLTVMAGEIEAKADKQELQTLEGNVTTISNDLASLSVAYDGITADIQSLEATTDGINTDITNLNTELSAVAGEVSSKVSAEYVTGAIADIEVGGRNLLRNSEEFVVSPRNTGTSSDNYNYASLLFEAKEGETYTISFDIEITHGDFKEVSMYEGYPGGLNRVISIDENTRNSHTFTIRESATNADRILIYAGRSGSTRGNGIILRNVKIEKGNKATDWTPAPEDVQAEIDSVYQYASSEFSQLPGKLALKADATVVDGIESRVTTAELNIDALDGAITSKVSEGDVRSIFTQEAGSFTFDADQINFNGHVFGQNATFTGDITGATITGSEFIASSTQYGRTTIGDGRIIGISDEGVRGLSSYDSYEINPYAISVMRTEDKGVTNSRSTFINPGVISLNHLGNGSTIRQDNEWLAIDSELVDFRTSQVYFSGDIVFDGSIRPQVHAFLNLINGWSNFGSGFQPARYTKNADGTVLLSGLIQGGSAGTACARLPAGCRPNLNETFGVYGSGGGGTLSRIRITSDGYIDVTNHEGGFLTLSGVVFRAEK